MHMEDTPEFATTAVVEVERAVDRLNQKVKFQTLSLLRPTRLNNLVTMTTAATRVNLTTRLSKK